MRPLVGRVHKNALAHTCFASSYCPGNRSRFRPGAGEWGDEQMTMSTLALHLLRPPVHRPESDTQILTSTVAVSAGADFGKRPRVKLAISAMSLDVATGTWTEMPSVRPDRKKQAFVTKLLRRAVRRLSLVSGRARRTPHRQHRARRCRRSKPGGRSGGTSGASSDGDPDPEPPRRPIAPTCASELREVSCGR
jgi:hypothetical protein